MALIEGLCESNFSTMARGEDIEFFDAIEDPQLQISADIVKRIMAATDATTMESFAKQLGYEITELSGGGSLTSRWFNRRLIGVGSNNTIPEREYLIGQGISHYLLFGEVDRPNSNQEDIYCSAHACLILGLTEPPGDYEIIEL